MVLARVHVLVIPGLDYAGLAEGGAEDLKISGQRGGMRSNRLLAQIGTASISGVRACSMLPIWDLSLTSDHDQLLPKYGRQEPSL